MKTRNQRTKNTIRLRLTLTLLISSYMLTACSSLQKNITLNEAPTRVDASFGKSVQRMLAVQKRPASKQGLTAGNQLDGTEAERIISILAHSK